MYAATEQHKQDLESANAPKFILDLASSGLLSVRKAPTFADVREEFVAHYGDIAHCIKPMDGAWFSGVMPWSIGIRIATISVASHGGLLFPKHGEHVQLIDTCEGKGCRNLPFVDEVHKNYGQHWYKGQWYWGPMAANFREKISITSAENEALKRVGGKYGHWAILGEAAWNMPIIREFKFLKSFRDIESEDGWLEKSPYCSMFQSLICQLAGADPVPGRALQYTTPQDTWQSLAWPIKIALII